MCKQTQIKTHTLFVFMTEKTLLRLYVADPATFPALNCV